MVSGNGLKLPIAKSKFTVNKYGQVLVKEQINPLDDPQLKLYDKQTGKLQDYIKKPHEIEDEW